MGLGGRQPTLPTPAPGAGARCRGTFSSLDRSTPAAPPVSKRAHVSTGPSYRARHTPTPVAIAACAWKETFQGAAVGRDPLNSRTCPFPSPKHSPHTALTAPARDKTQRALLGAAAPHVVDPPSPYLARTAREKKRKEVKRWRVAGMHEGLGQVGGVVVLTQDNQDRPGLATRGMKKRVPLQLPKMRGCQSVTNAGWKRFKLDIPPPIAAQPARMGTGAQQNPAPSKGSKRLQWWGRGRRDEYRLMGHTCSLT